MKRIRGQTISFSGDGDTVTHHEAGLVVINDEGRIVWVGDFSDCPLAYRMLPIDDHGKKLVLPGFVDAHIHFPQHRLLAAPGKDLLDWLQRFTFPEEARYGDEAYAAAAAEIFLDHLAAHGTTSALAFCSVHKACATALFEAAEKRGMALITGKTMMDRNAIPAVHDVAEQSAIDTADLHNTWHGKGRLRHAITPRFAITSSDAQLSYAEELLRALKGALLQTHISESAGEIAYVAELFPWSKDYTDVYDRFGLLSERSLFAHGIHLNAREVARFAESKSSVVHCPTSNTFLGSGLMSMMALKDVSLGLATDIGGGTSYSMLATMGEAYKVQMLNGYKPTAMQLFAMATIGNAARLHLDDEIGSFVIGKYADLVVLDPEATPVLKHRNALSQSLEDQLFALMILGDDRAVAATYIAGKKVHDNRSA